MSILWKHAAADDAPKLAEWNHRLICDEGHRNPMTVSELEQRMRGWLTDTYQAVIYSRDDSSLGYALYATEEESIYLRHFFISPEFRRHGYGRECFQILRDEIWLSDVRLSLAVLCRNEVTIAFWRKMGYVDYCLTLEIMPGADHR